MGLTSKEELGMEMYGLQMKKIELMSQVPAHLLALATGMPEKSVAFLNYITDRNGRAEAAKWLNLAPWDFLTEEKIQESIDITKEIIKWVEHLIATGVWISQSDFKKMQVNTE